MDSDILRLRNRLDELRAFRVRSAVPLDSGTFRAHDAAAAVPIELGSLWPSLVAPAHFDFRADIPEEWTGSIRLRLDLGGEALLRVNGSTVGGLNPNHVEYDVTGSATPGLELHIEAEAMPYGPFGSARHRPEMAEAALLHVDADIEGLWLDLESTHQVAAAMAAPRPDFAQRLVDVLQDVVSRVPIPRAPSEAYLAQVAQEFRTRATPDEGGFRDLWERWTFGSAGWQPDEAFVRAVRSARARLTAALSELREMHPPQGRLAMVGHTHIDLAWLWPLAETRRKVRRSFATVLHLMDRDPSFHFAQASPQVYAYLEEDDPEMFAAVRRRVEEGRWELLGGMWVEPDGNLPSGESWARQLLHGQRYFEDRFGKRATVGWLPDTFGYAGNLPQLFRSAGLEGFFTTKLSWNETNRFPHDLYLWAGIDGSSIPTHSFRNPDGGYNGTVNAESLRATWENFRGQRWHDASLYTFGFGDGGGGPTDDMLHRVAAYRDFPGMPRTEYATVEGFFERIDGTRLPVWRGEQYLEFHRGTYTAQARLKALNRRLEATLKGAEVAAVVAEQMAGAPYPHDRLHGAWTVLLRNQFHDILPGSSVRSVYQEAEGEMEAELEQALEIRAEALAAATAAVRRGAAAPAKGDATVVVWNLDLHDRPLEVSFGLGDDAPAGVFTTDGDVVPFQQEGRKLTIATDAVSVPGIGYRTLVLRGEVSEPAAHEENEANRSEEASTAPSPDSVERVYSGNGFLENRYLRVEIAPDGTIHRVTDKEAGREVLADRANQIWVHPDVPANFDAWDVDASYMLEGEELVADEPPELVRTGPVEAAIRVRRTWHGCTIEQEYRLSASSRRLEIRTSIDWHARRTMLRARFPVAVRSHEAFYETTFGAVARPTHRNTSWDSARFEVPGHRWADLSEGDYGVSLLTDGKHGFAVHDDVMSLTLLTSSVHPDPWADEGRHDTTYALYPHAGTWRTGTVRQAEAMAAPLAAVPGGPKSEPERMESAASPVASNEAPLPPTARLLGVDTDAITLAALKRAEDGDRLVLRVYEAHGTRGVAKLAGAWQVVAMQPASVLEERLDDRSDSEHAEVESAFTYQPFRVSTFRIRVAGGAEGATEIG